MFNKTGFICSSVLYIIFILLSSSQTSFADSFDRNSIVCNVNVSYRNVSVARATDNSVLMLTASRINFIPSGFFQTHAELTTLYLDFVDLLELQKGDFSGAKNLKQYFGRGNSVKFLNESVFVGAENLVNISMSSNLIEFVDESAFHELSDLKLLDLSKNSIKNLKFLSRLSNLQFLFMNFNSLESLEDETFEKNQELKVIEFNFNRIKTITANSLNNVIKTVTKIGLLENECINADIAAHSNINITNCLHKTEFSDKIEACRGREFNFDDVCLKTTKHKLEIYQNCQDKFQIVEIIKSNIHIVTEKSENVSRLNTQLLDSIKLVRRNLKDCLRQHNGIVFLESSWAHLLTFFASFAISSVLIVLFIVWKDRKMRYEGSNILVEFSDDCSEASW